MRLVERHVVKKRTQAYSELDKLAFSSKNLYNASLYRVRQHYFETKKYLSYPELNKLMHEDENYVSLPRKVAQQTQKLVDQNFKSFFASLKAKVKTARVPSYLDKEGKQVLMFTEQAISKRVKGHIRLSGTSFLIPTDKDVVFARVVPGNNNYTVELGYDAECKHQVVSDNYASVDLGVNNLATIAYSDGTSEIINGKPLKSINQFYNKVLAEEKSLQAFYNRKSTNKIKSLWNRRNNKIKDYMHKASRYLVNQLVSRNISTLVVGQNSGWKQDINIGKRNNQNFVSIPYWTFILMLKYKCALEGIAVELVKESYTSKCSFLDGEDVCKHEEYAGKRVKRGLFRSKSGRVINADVNAAFNILKVAGKIFNPVAVCSTPCMVSL